MITMDKNRKKYLISRKEALKTMDGLALGGATLFSSLASSSEQST
jgi:hypothetical protein